MRNLFRLEKSIHPLHFYGIHSIEMNNLVNGFFKIASRNVYKITSGKCGEEN